MMAVAWVASKAIRGQANGETATSFDQGRCSQESEFDRWIGGW